MNSVILGLSLALSALGVGAVTVISNCYFSKKRVIRSNERLAKDNIELRQEQELQWNGMQNEYAKLYKDHIMVQIERDEIQLERDGAQIEIERLKRRLSLKEVEETPKERKFEEIIELKAQNTSDNHVHFPVNSPFEEYKWDPWLVLNFQESLSYAFWWIRFLFLLWVVITLFRKNYYICLRLSLLKFRIQSRSRYVYDSFFSKLNQHSIDHLIAAGIGNVFSSLTSSVA